MKSRTGRLQHLVARRTRFESTTLRSVLVLIDGRSVYTPLFAGRLLQVQDTLLEDIDRIEVIRGPAAPSGERMPSTRYQTSSLKRVRKPMERLVSTGGGNVDQGFLQF